MCTDIYDFISRGSFQLIFLNKRKVYLVMSRSFATQALSRTATNITKQSTISTQNTFTFFFKFVSPNLVAGLKNTMSSAQFGWSPTHPPRACCTSLVLELHLLITPPLLAKSPFVPLRGITWLPQPIWAGPPHLPQAPFEHKVSVSVEEGQGHLQPGNDEDVEEDVHKAGWLLVV